MSHVVPGQDVDVCGLWADLHFHGGRAGILCAEGLPERAQALQVLQSDQAVERTRRGNGRGRKPRTVRSCLLVVRAEDHRTVQANRGSACILSHVFPIATGIRASPVVVGFDTGRSPQAERAPTMEGLARPDLFSPPGHRSARRGKALNGLSACVTSSRQLWAGGSDALRGCLR
jgi:hypothetical protein